MTTFKEKIDAHRAALKEEREEFNAFMFDMYGANAELYTEDQLADMDIIGRELDEKFAICDLIDTGRRRVSDFK